MVRPTGGASRGVEAGVFWIEFDGLINLFDRMVVVAREPEAGCGQDEGVSLLAFGRFFPNFPERRARWDAAGRKDRILRSGGVSGYTQDGQTYRQYKDRLPDGARLVGTPAMRAPRPFVRV